MDASIAAFRSASETFDELIAFLSEPPLTSTLIDCENFFPLVVGVAVILLTSTGEAQPVRVAVASTALDKQKMRKSDLIIWVFFLS